MNNKLQEEAIAKLAKELKSDDQEDAHIGADNVLCGLLSRGLG